MGPVGGDLEADISNSSSIACSIILRKIIEQAIEDEFDISASKSPPTGPKGPKGIGHAVGFVYRRLLNDKPIPLVPILINTFFPPNQVKPKRCYEFGLMIGRGRS